GWANNWNAENNSSVTNNGGPHGGSRHALLTGNSDGRITRRVNMSGVTNASLEFWWKASSLEGNDKMRVRIYDGSWDTAFTISNGDDDNTYHKKTIDLSGYSMVSDFRIRFDSDDVESGDYFVIDDIEITGNQ
ncbi:MAG: hypothetical protein OES12_07045, partial [Anaerolineae bacterium]|nr:hypothetical protein [Anaerolineae bacterium]